MYKIIAHRALNNHNYKENSIEAILDSLSKDYIDGVEIDVRISKDKKLVLNHNCLIDINNGFVKNKTVKELKKFNIVTLNEVLKSINTKKVIVIDLKDEGKGLYLIKEIKKVIKKYNYLNLYICSFRYDLVKDLIGINSKIGLIIGYFLNKNKNYDEFDFLSLNYKEKIKSNKEIMLWTINSKDILKKIKIDDFYLITDCAYKFKDFL